MTHTTSNLAIFPLHRWAGADPVALGNQLVRIAVEQNSLDARHMLLIERQRALKARLAATGLPEPLRRATLAEWTRRALDAEQIALREQKAL